MRNYGIRVRARAYRNSLLERLTSLPGVTLLLLSVALSAAASAIPLEPQTASQSQTAAAARFEQARQALARGDLHSALAEVRAVLRSAPHNVEGMNLMGIILDRQGNSAGALRAFEKAIAISPDSTETHNNLGSFYVRERKLDLAEKEFRATLRLNPHDHTANYNLAAILLSRRDSQDAIRYLLHVQPTDAATQFNLVQAYLETGQTAKALTAASALSERAPQDVRLHFSLGTLLASAKQYKPAIHELELADALRPGTFEILHNLGEAYLRGGEDAKADAALNHALALKPDSVSTMYIEAQALAREKKTLEAFQLLFQARKLAPKNTDVIFLLARLSMQQSYYEDAIPLLEEGIKLAPRRPDLRAALGESYYSAGKIPKAYEQFQDLLKLDPSVSSYVFMGLYYRHQGQFNRAQKYFQKGLEKDPRSADCLYNLGLIADKQGHYLEAEKFLTQALKSNPSHGDALFELATVKMEEKEFTEAVPLLRRCVELNPNQSKAYYKLAVAERNLRQNQAAETDMKVFETLAKNPSPGPMPFQHFIESVSQKVSLPPTEQAELDLRELAQEIKAHPDRPRAFYLEAQDYLKLGRVSEARQALNELRQMSSGDVRTMTGAGVLLARYKLYPDAIQYFALALKADPSSDDAKYDLADAYFETRSYAQAREWLERISSESQNDPAALALRGDTEAHLGNLTEAASSFEKAIQKSPDDDRYYLSLAFVKMRAGNLAEAQETLERGQARTPDSGRILWGMGVLAVAQANNQQAEDYLRRALDLLPEWENSYSALGTFYFDTGQITKAEETLDRYAKIFPHGDLNVNGLRQMLLEASREQTATPVPLSLKARQQFVEMALALAERHP